MDRIDYSMEMTKNHLINRMFNTLIILFFATPFLFILYGQLQQQMIGIDIREILEMNPYLNVIFITSFVTPFIGFYMLHLKQELEKELSREVALTHLFAITISFLIMGNFTYGLFVSILIYFMYLEWKTGVKEIYRHFKAKTFNIKDWLAPIIILIIALIIRFMLMLVSNT